MARDMDVIWGKREGKYFLHWDWTGSISLIGFDKLAVRRNVSTLTSVAIFSPPSFRGDAKHRTRNLEIPVWCFCSSPDERRPYVLPRLRRLALDAQARVARTGRVEPHARRTSHGGL
jgi:hypothetical protein